MTIFFLSIYKLLKSNRLYRYLLLFCLLVFLLFFASKVSLEEDIAGFMPKDKNSERVNFVYKNIGIADKLIVRFSAQDTAKEIDKDRLIDASEVFVNQLDSLTQNKNLIKDIFYKIDQQQIYDVASFITQNIPYFIENDYYTRLDSLFTPEKIKIILENNKKILISPAGMVLKQNIINDPLHLSSSTLGRLRDFQVSNQYENYNNYIFSKKGNDLLLFITSSNAVSETAKNKELVKCIDQCINNTQSTFKQDIRISYFGAAAVAVTNAERIKADSYISIIIAVILILVLLLWFFKSVKSILYISVPVVFGALLSLAALYFIKGTISAIAIGAGSVIFGIAINYSLHFLIHSKHEQNPEKVLKDLVFPMLTGSITTVGAFLSLLFISANSMRDFGLFAAFSLTGTLLFVLIFMPHFKISGVKSTEKHSFFDRISDYRFEKNKYILLTVFILTIVFLFFSFNVSFETNMNKINYMKPDQKQAFEELSNFTSLGKKSIYLVSEGKNLDDALRCYEKSRLSVDSLTRNGSITNTVGIGLFLPSDSMQKIRIDCWNNFWKTRKESVKKMLLEQGSLVGFKKESFDAFFHQLDYNYAIQKTDYFSVITDNFVKEYLIVRQNKVAVITLLYTIPNRSDSVSAALTHGNTFVFDSGSMSKSLINMLSSDFNKVLYCCSLLVLVFLTLSFGRLELSLISFLPMLISWVWILGIMSIFGIHFNIVNIILATFIFGLGDDYTIFMMDGMMNEYAYHRKLLSSYKTAVALSAITMFIGIGTLVFAKHPAMKSLADVTIIGMISVVIISYVIPPLLYNYLTMKKNKKRLIPITFRNLIATVYSFVFFLLGSLVLTITGFILLTVGKANEKNKLRYHWILCYTARFVVKHLPMVKTHIINKYGETFNKPGIIICNHQAHLDLMFVMMLSPRVVILTNEWVWNSPFYGQIIKYADFYPVADGIENSVERLSTLVERGYSIVVFPEGTRSEDCSILRFHRGAFYLAEKLQLDIIPIVVHGIGHALPKKELLLRKGEVTVNILERITPNNISYGEDYAQRSKQVRQLYKIEYQKLCDLKETPAYYSNLVIHNYIYKGASVEKYARKLIKKYNSFEALIALLPSTGSLLNLNCQYGVFALICSLVKKELSILAIDTDEDMLNLALNCASKPSNLNFKKYNLSDVSLSDFDFTVIINPSDTTAFEHCLLQKNKVYLLIEKSNKNYEKIMSFKGFNILDVKSKYIIIAWKTYD